MDFFNCSDNTIRKWFYSFNTKLKVLGRTSYLEQDIRNHLLKYFNNEELVYNTKKIITPKELDIYIPTLNLAIEINSLFWHSFNNDSKKNYHINQSDYDFMKFRHQFKTLECLKKGIRLLHIYEDDDYINKIDNFINWVHEPKDIYELDSGCYPIVNKFYISEPVEIKVLNNRSLWKAGFMKINKGEQ